MKKSVINLLLIGSIVQLNATFSWPAGFVFNKADSEKRESIVQQLDEYKEKSGFSDEMSEEELKGLYESLQVLDQEKSEEGRFNKLKKYILCLISKFYLEK